MASNSQHSTGRADALLSGLVAMLQPKKVVTVGDSSAGITLSRALESVAPEVSPQLWNFVAGPSESVTESLFDLPPRSLEEIGPVDLVWINGESLVTNARILRALWPHVAEGGVLAVQNSFSPAGSNPLWNAILRFGADDIETLTLPGIGLLRKRSEPVREVDFTDEMVSATGVPLRFESIGVHDDAPLLDHATGVLHALADSDLRAVLFAIGSGVSTVAALQSHTSLSVRATHKAIARLLTLSVVTRVGDRLVVDENTLKSFRNLPRTTPPPTDMPRHSRDRGEFLRAIARQLSTTGWSSERQVNELCSFFDDDYATLRRELVDAGFLERNSAGSMYRAQSND
ncbi:DUF2087 domain-containing protein [Rhodococcus sp. IEGM 1401]|uniref:DUF2087 domain-containing protein n=1 Tax=unclassified Rhodococcus (in: high G+C Gram-positive bacteria) TaxID=192944 RepID=UPI0022B53EAB|nr:MULTISPECIES: DUF2087 domain-containing protein [unclassified Rhodococcus (in: high G+C Gram-positive bacteria)]MCZ4562928.1 DUF2087 domain-containing protein [Rhodococcus sp. IEGM 1401]MDI9923041.1 DUF2087 domain-containing protein [Rhodococcus sp. IEGM 1372]MDV8035598.1 DUF2087 domain-containing protein [Rhodococcus sp. IEGM 1414]